MINTTTDFIAAARDFGPVVATLAGQPITGVLGTEPAAALGDLVGEDALVFTVTSGTVAADPRGQTLVADGVSHTVRDFRSAEGLRVLILESV